MERPIKPTINKLIKRTMLEQGYEFSVEHYKIYPRAKATHFYCLVPENPEYDSDFQYASRGYGAYVGIFTKDQRGYEIAIERHPHFDNLCESCGQLMPKKKL